MGCGIPAGIYAHTRVQNEPALKYPPGSHWMFPFIWHMSHLHSPVFQTASTESTQSSLQHLSQASTSVSLQTTPSVSLVQTASQERMASNPTSRLPYSFALRTEPLATGSGLTSVLHSPLCPSHLCSTHRFSPSFRSVNSWGD